jgi:cellulose synthase/poly-beta-1,6-N-acetylglucosamine synthase-like glycosyltransferase
MTFETFLFIITLIYIFQIGIFVYGLGRGNEEKRMDKPLFVSVIIAARNEESMLPLCLESVANQTYPESLYEIIVVNDASVDRTKEVSMRFSERHPHIRTIDADEDANNRGKANALACGIDAAKGEIILITDADCIVPKKWVESTVARYREGVGLVGGFTLQKSDKPFEGMQSLDWAFILGMAVSTANLNHPLGSIGNNLSFRKDAYDKVGGYRKLKFSVTEDYTIVQAITGSGDWKYVYPLDPDRLVRSKPCEDLLTLIRQKHRWGKGGLDMKPAGLAIMVIGFLMHISPFILLCWGGVVQAATALMLKFSADYFFLFRVLSKLNRTEELRWFYWFELYFLIYVVILPFLVFFGGRVEWKGRKF